MSKPESLQVLFVDDEPQVRAAFSRLAKSRGLNAETAATGAEAIALAQSEPYDIVVTDLRMPGMSGSELLQHLVPILPSARFVVVTASSPAQLTVDAPTERRVLRVLSKPWDNDQLIACIRGETPPQAPRQATDPPTRERPLRVLVVEDDLDHYRLLRVALRRSQAEAHTLEHVRTLADARRELVRQTYDVIVCDLGLPDSGGLETAILLRAAAPATPIVVLTGGHDDTLPMRALRVGVQDYLQKGTVGGSSINRALQYAVERGSIERRMLEMARSDPLTGLGNRSLFRERLALALARARRGDHRLAVLYLDLDHFKRINDALGHDAGDAFLQEAGRRLAANVREYDTVARFGGDEFAILLDGLDSERDVGHLVRRILLALREPMQLYDAVVTTTASIGVAMFPQCTTTDELLESADTALYECKRSGRDRFCFFDREMQEASRRRLSLEAELTQAFTRGEFELVYQKQVLIATGQVVGIEALLRWRRHGELVGPKEFISILEESPQILQVGDWVLREALRQLAAWRREKIEVPRVSVNVSARQFSHPNFVPGVAKALADTGTAPCDLELEITEAVLLGDIAAAKSTAQELHDLGVRLAIDDFGTGYSSLKYLLELPIDVLKIDRSFVQGLDSGDRHAPIVRAVLGLAQSLDMAVVAEGVEDTLQRDMLLELGCAVAQGYYYHVPEEATKLTRELNAMAVSESDPACVL